MLSYISPSTPAGNLLELFGSTPNPLNNKLPIMMKRNITLTPKSKYIKSVFLEGVCEDPSPEIGF